MKTVIVVCLLAASGLIRTVSTKSIWIGNGIGTLTLIDLAKNVTHTTASVAKLKKNVLFYLYTPVNPTTPQRLYVEDKRSLSNSSFNSSLPTRILIHGWMSNAFKAMDVHIREAYLSAGGYNVIVVDWDAYTKAGYINAASHVKVVARYVTLMINFLERQGMRVADLTIVGHSLGAHVGGIAARNAANKVGYVVGLDPAFPLFSTASAGSRISQGDASYVQIIHTSAGIIGFNRNLGDVDFWPNGGSKQPGCHLDMVGSCAHGRSHLYFSESIKSTSAFRAHSCSSYKLYQAGSCNSTGTALMGGVSPTTTASGSHYLKTNKASPYSQS